MKRAVIPLMCSLGFFPMLLRAQTSNDSTRAIHDLTEVKVTDWKLAHRTDALPDTLLQLFYNNATLADALQTFGGAAIRQYGASGSAVISVNGYSPQQTQVTWENVPVNNPMLGQCDLSLVPMALSGTVTLNEDASDAPGGRVDVHANGADSGFVVSTHHTYNSLQNRSHALSVNTGRRLRVSVNAEAQSEKNSFRYDDLEGKKVWSEHASMHQYGASSTLAYLFKSNRLSAGSFGVYAQRDLPPTMLQLHSAANETDAPVVGFFRYEHAGAFNINVQASTVYHKLDYNDSLTNEYDRSHSLARMLETNASHAVFKNIWLHAGASGSYISADVSPNIYNRSETQALMKLGVSQALPRMKTKLEAEAVQQFWNMHAQPFNYNLGIVTLLSRHASLSVHHARVNRLPTLNDRYWQPGGNANLKPELAYRNHAELSLHVSHQHFTFNAACRVRYDIVQNLIQWIPVGGVWMPENVKSARLYGLEPLVDAAFSNKHLNLQLKASYNVTHAVTAESFVPNDASVGKQNIYTPLRTWHAHASLRYKSWQAFAAFNHIDKRFTASDDSQWLAGYAFLDAGIAKTFSMSWLSFTAACNVTNITGTTYQSVAYRPMPKQVITLQLILEIKSNQNKKS